MLSKETKPLVKKDPEAKFLISIFGECVYILDKSVLKRGGQLIVEWSLKVFSIYGAEADKD